MICSRPGCKEDAAAIAIGPASTRFKNPDALKHDLTGVAREAKAPGGICFVHLSELFPDKTAPEVREWVEAQRVEAKRRREEDLERAKQRRRDNVDKPDAPTRYRDTLLR